MERVGDADLSRLPLRQGRDDDSRAQYVCRAGIAGIGVAEVERDRDERVSPAFSRARGPLANAEPGAILIGAVRDFCRSWKNQTEVTVPGSHFIQEDPGPAIGRAVADWMKANSI